MKPKYIPFIIVGLAGLALLAIYVVANQHQKDLEKTVKGDAMAGALLGGVGNLFNSPQN